MIPTGSLAMVQVSRTKKQHFIPRFYLERFTDKKGLLWTHDSERDTVRQTTPENTGFETNIYSPKLEGDDRFDEIELTLSKVESAAAAILPELLSFKRLDDRAKADFALFLGTMFARSPAQLRQFAELHGKVWNWAGRISLDHEHRQMEKEGKQNDANIGVREFLRNTNNYTMQVDRRVGLTSFQHCEVLAELMSRMSWTFELSEGQELLTSDNSVFWVSGGPLPITGPYGFGLGHRQAVIPFPLSPEVILRLDWIPGPGWTKHRLTKKQARLSNQYQAKHKNRFLFFRSRDEGFRRLGMKYAEPVKNIDAGVDGPPIAVVRKLQ
jgi:hypothetical protein